MTNPAPRNVDFRNYYLHNKRETIKDPQELKKSLDKLIDEHKEFIEHMKHHH